MSVAPVFEAKAALKEEEKQAAQHEIDASSCYKSDKNETVKDSNPNISNHSQEENDDPLEAASREFDQIDTQKKGLLNWD